MVRCRIALVGPNQPAERHFSNVADPDLVALRQLARRYLPLASNARSKNRSLMKAIQRLHSRLGEHQSASCTLFTCQNYDPTRLAAFQPIGKSVVLSTIPRPFFQGPRASRVGHYCFTRPGRSGPSRSIGTASRLCSCITRTGDDRGRTGNP